MPRIALDTLIDAPIERCFDAARDIGLHTRLARRTRERAVAGRVKGRIEKGEWVTFSGVHFGLRLQLTATVVDFEAPYSFTDQQETGPFALLRHKHNFEALDIHRTQMHDLIEFRAPCGLLGRVAEPIVAWHLKHFLEERASELKKFLEQS